MVWLDMVSMGMNWHDEEGALAKPCGEVGLEEGLGCNGDRRWLANLTLLAL